MIEGVLEPAHQGRDIQYRPPAWIERSREGAIEVLQDCPLLLVEGVGAGRRELARWVDVLVWVQSHYEEAERRGVLRDGGDARAAAFWQEWMEQELPFQAAQRPWERADFIVNGTPDGHGLPDILQVAEGPLYE